MALFESRMEQSMDFGSEPAVVAEACQQAIASIRMKVKEISREAGTITATNEAFSFEPERRLLIGISKVGDVTRVNVSAIKQKGLLATAGADKLLSEFFTALAENPILKGKSTAGW